MLKCCWAAVYTDKELLLNVRFKVILKCFIASYKFYFSPVLLLRNKLITGVMELMKGLVTGFRDTCDNLLPVTTTQQINYHRC
jgi:hypothetical protein